MDPKELYLQVVEEMVAAAMDRNPKLTWSGAYASVDGQKAYDAMRDRLADMADALKRED